MVESHNGRAFNRFAWRCEQQSVDQVGINHRAGAVRAQHAVDLDEPIVPGWSHYRGLRRPGGENDAGVGQRWLVQVPVYVIDEPFLGLDPLGIHSFLEMVREKKAQGAAILMSTHVLASAEKECDNFVLLHHGEVKVTGTMVDLQYEMGMLPSYDYQYFKQGNEENTDYYTVEESRSREVAFFATGTYDKKRDFKVTTSPSMDILVSSNLERLIFHLLGNDATKTKELMDALVTKGEYTLADADKDILDLFAAGFATEDETAAEIKRVYDEDKYIEDPHTAVASAVYEAYVQKTDDHTPTVIASTASPYKFPRVAVSAVTGKDSGDDFKAVEDLHQLSGVAIPAAVDGLEHAEVRHKTVVAAADMQKAVESYLGV